MLKVLKKHQMVLATQIKKTKVEEFVPRFAYQYNKKLKFSSFYAFKTEKEHDGDKNKADKFRFEAKYSF